MPESPKKSCRSTIIKRLLCFSESLEDRCNNCKALNSSPFAHTKLNAKTCKIKYTYRKSYYRWGKKLRTVLKQFFESAGPKNKKINHLCS